jgi:hypothetical protein
LAGRVSPRDNVLKSSPDDGAEREDAGEHEGEVEVFREQFTYIRVHGGKVNGNILRMGSFCACN